jgi:hypothetical protein
MANDVKTYDVSDANGSFDALAFTGLAEGSFGKYEPFDTEPTRVKEGADKEAAFIVNKPGGGMFRLKLMYTSDANRVLTAKYYAKTAGVFEFEDSLGNRCFSRQAMIQSIPPGPEGAGGDGPEDREWVFLLTNTVIKAPSTTTPV